MGKGFRKFVEWFSDCKYVPVGSRCSICNLGCGCNYTPFDYNNSSRCASYINNFKLCGNTILA